MRRALGLGLLPWLIVAGAFALCLGLVATGSAVLAAALAALALGALIASRRPVLATVALVALAMGPQLLHNTPQFSESWLSLGNVPLTAFVLLPMAGAVAARLVLYLARRAPALRRRAFAIAALLAASLAVWLGFEVVRNLGVYRLSAVREFSLSYLVLVVPVYLAVFVRSNRLCLRTFRITVAAVLIAPLAFIPLVGYLKGWSIGPDARFFHSAINLALVEGAIATVLLVRARARARADLLALWPMGFVVLMLTIADSHRSVWLASAVGLLALIALGEVKASRFWQWGFVGLAALLLAVMVLSFTGTDVPHYVTTRAQAFSNPSSDATSEWRLSVWRAGVRAGRAHLLSGQGFGSYYSYELSTGRDVTVQPHNYYVQTFLKLGLVGLVLYTATIVATFVVMLVGWRRLRSRSDLITRPVVVMGILALLMSLAYSIVYPMDVISLVFVGLGLAAIRQSFREVPAPGP